MNTLVRFHSFMTAQIMKRLSEYKANSSIKELQFDHKNWGFLVPPSLKHSSLLFCFVIEREALNIQPRKKRETWIRAFLHVCHHVLQ